MKDTDISEFTSLESELYHHGIKGMKWGVRRYQNADGSLTAAGQKRYYDSGGNLTRSGQRFAKKQARTLKKLQDRADLNKQRENIEKYDKRAGIAKKVGLASAGVAAGGNLARKAISIVRNKDFDVSSSLLKSIDNEGRKLSTEGWKEMKAIADRVGWTKDANKVKAYEAMSEKYTKLLGENDAAYNSTLDKYLSRDRSRVNIYRGVQTAQKVAAGVAIASAGYYAYNKIQKHLAQKRMTDIGHQQALKNVKEQSDRMMKMFGTTKLDDILKKKT